MAGSCGRMGVKMPRCVASAAVNSLPLWAPFELNIFLPRFFLCLTPLKRIRGSVPRWSGLKVGRFLSPVARRESSLLPFLPQRLTGTKAERENLKFYGEVGAKEGGNSKRPKNLARENGM